uniref:ribonuclease toxin immunity protein CdiI n=1 Tax=Pseudomonas aeruginosa TaxID=287 RepID=UPI001F4BA86B
CGGRRKTQPTVRDGLTTTGVEFSYGYPTKDEDTIVVSEAVCSKFIRLACENYLQRHPEDTEKVKELLDKLSF